MTSSQVDRLARLAVTYCPAMWSELFGGRTVGAMVGPAAVGAVGPGGFDPLGRPDGRTDATVEGEGDSDGFGVEDGWFVAQKASAPPPDRPSTSTSVTTTLRLGMLNSRSSESLTDRWSSPAEHPV